MQEAASWIGRGLLVTEGEKSEVAVATGGASRVKGPCRERGAGGGSLLSRLEAGAPGAHMAVPLEGAH